MNTIEILSNDYFWNKIFPASIGVIVAIFGWIYNSWFARKNQKKAFEAQVLNEVRMKINEEMDIQFKWISKLNNILQDIVYILNISENQNNSLNSKINQLYSMAKIEEQRKWFVIIKRHYLLFPNFVDVMQDLVFLHYKIIMAVLQLRDQFSKTNDPNQIIKYCNSVQEWIQFESQLQLDLYYHFEYECLQSIDRMKYRNIYFESKGKPRIQKNKRNKLEIINRDKLQLRDEGKLARELLWNAI